MHRPFVRCGDGWTGDSGKKKDASSIGTYMVFGLEKTGGLVRGMWDEVGEKGWLEKEETVIRETKRPSGKGKEEEEEEEYGEWRAENCALDYRLVAIVGIMKARRDFSPFQSYARAHGGTISRMTDCANPLAARLARRASPRSHVVREGETREGTADGTSCGGDQYRVEIPL